MEQINLILNIIGSPDEADLVSIGKNKKKVLKIFN
jgi:hypothetical protein